MHTAPAGVATALLVAVVLVIGSIGILLGSPKPAGADHACSRPARSLRPWGTPRSTSTARASGDPLLETLNDGQSEPYTAGSAFDSSGNLYVTDDYRVTSASTRPTARSTASSPAACQNPLSLAFDSQGNLYVGQQATPYIAEFTKTGQFIQNIGPLATELTGDDWIALAPDDCTVYYTTEGTDILRYNMCTNQQLPNFNLQPFPTGDPSTGLPVQAFELQILPDGDVLVADSNADILLDHNGNVVQTYTCASLPGCQGSFSPSASTPTGSRSGLVTRPLATSGRSTSPRARCCRQIDTHSGASYGLSVDDQIEVACARDHSDDRTLDADRPAGDGQLLDADAGLGGADESRARARPSSTSRSPSR